MEEHATAAPFLRLFHAAVEQMEDAKKFCTAAYHLKQIQETIFEPFVVVTNDATFTEDNDGIMDAGFKTW